MGTSVWDAPEDDASASDFLLLFFAAAAAGAFFAAGAGAADLDAALTAGAEPLPAAMRAFRAAVSVPSKRFSFLRSGSTLP